LKVEKLFENGKTYIVQR